MQDRSLPAQYKLAHRQRPNNRLHSDERLSEGDPVPYQGRQNAACPVGGPRQHESNAFANDGAGVLGADAGRSAALHAARDQGLPDHGWVLRRGRHHRLQTAAQRRKLIVLVSHHQERLQQVQCAVLHPLRPLRQSSFPSPEETCALEQQRRGVQRGR